MENMREVVVDIRFHVIHDLESCNEKYSRIWYSAVVTFMLLILMLIT